MGLESSAMRLMSCYREFQVSSVNNCNVCEEIKMMSLSLGLAVKEHTIENVLCVT